MGYSSLKLDKFLISMQNARMSHAQEARISGNVCFVRAYAKINLTLRVLGRRADGYHELESLVAFAGMGDALTFAPGGALTLAISGPTAQAAGDNADNLALKAARALAERIAGLTLGSFALSKRLPVAAGLGGGSADAGAALRLLARANGIALDDPRLMQAAQATGADVPVCLASQACDMTGVGEKLMPLNPPKMPSVLVNPCVPVPTKDVFEALGLRHGEFLIGAADVMLQASSWPEQGGSLEEWVEALAAGANDLEVPATRIQPLIGEVIAALNATNGAWLARMSGSGATCFAIYENTAEAQRAANKIRLDHPSWWVHAGVLS